jgi:signal transduction histidine kinase
VLLIVTIIATFVAARLSNRVVKRLKRLRADTLELADVRLPRMVNRLRDGAQIDIHREVPNLNYGRDELGQVAEAFNKAQRTAVGAAAQEAEIQVGVKAVFLNIAHRSQVVVRRQLEVLDKAERDQEDPDQLELLFQLDHLATRARRNAENLIILGGERPGRQWRNPVPLVEIVRSAIGETEHYRRVHTTRLPDMLISGTVVADLIHLLAELVDNATAFSPPDSRVEVRGNTVGKGVVVEVEDQGLGIPRDERESINAYLQDPPDFGVMSLSEEARLGLFVVSQLSARHGINVTLVDSAYGGIRAIVLIRSALIASGPADDGQRGGPATGPQNGVASTSRTDLPRPRRESIPDQPPAVPSQVRNPFPDDLDDLTDLSEATVQWSTQDSWPPAQASRRAQAANGNGHGNGHGNGNGRGGDESRPPLPRRRRQANLAPQLAAEAEMQAEQTFPDDEDTLPSAERARSRMSAFQRGSREGRQAN